MQTSSKTTRLIFRLGLALLGLALLLIAIAYFVQSGPGDGKFVLIAASYQIAIGGLLMLAMWLFIKALKEKN